MNLSGRDFLKLLDYSSEEIIYLIKLAKAFKIKKHNHEPHNYLKGKNVVLLFEKDSTRTRCAFEVGAKDLGMGVTYLGPTGSQMGKKESIADTARVLARMYDGIEYRGFEQKIVEELAKYSDVPVWNGLTNEFHPTQMLADIMTVSENFDNIAGKKLVFFGDGRNNVANSLMVICSKLGINYTCCAPTQLFPNQELINTCQEFAKQNNSEISITDNIELAIKNADVIYTDVWLSMGENANLWQERINLLSLYQVNKELMQKANPNAIFLHCLPSFHDLNTTIGQEVYEKFGLKEMEVTNEVFESPQSKVMDQAENRLHTIKAIMYATLKK